MSKLKRSKKKGRKKRSKGKNVDHIKRSKKEYRNKKRRRKQDERGKCRKKKYRTHRNVENAEDGVNRHFTIVLCSTGI